MKYTFPLKKTVGWTAHTSLADCPATSWRPAMFYLLSTSSLSGVEKVSPSTLLGSLSTDSRPQFTRGWARLIEPTISIGRWPVGKSSIPKVECRMRKIASTMPKVGCRKRKLKGQRLNDGCEKMNVHSTELEGRIRKLDCWLWKSWMSKAKTGMLHKSKLNAECKKIESRVQTSMTNTKCKIDCAKYNVKWNIEFWQKWNAQNTPVTELSRLS